MYGLYPGQQLLTNDVVETVTKSTNLKFTRKFVNSTNKDLMLTHLRDLK